MLSWYSHKFLLSFKIFQVQGLTEEDSHFMPYAGAGWHQEDQLMILHWNFYYTMLHVSLKVRSWILSKYKPSVYSGWLCPGWYIERLGRNCIPLEEWWHHILLFLPSFICHLILLFIFLDTIHTSAWGFLYELAVAFWICLTSWSNTYGIWPSPTPTL